LPNEIVRQCWKAIDLATRRAIFDCNVLALTKAAVLETLAEPHKQRRILRRIVSEKSNYRRRVPLRPRRERQYLRRILIVGAHAVLRRAKENPEKFPWITQLLSRRPFKVVAVALANKMARVAWALLARGGTYRAPAIAAAA
jgi:transposase